jgi:aminopeptidase N
MYIFVNNTNNNISSFSRSIIYSYYLILININTRYVEYRSSTSVKNALKSIFNKLTIKKLEFDEEKSFVIAEQLHQSLCIIDRFIRTMRDYIKKNEPADDSKITRFIKAYNHTIHKETGISLHQMQNVKHEKLIRSLIN